ncbi:helix-turn-helix domain-containing protein [Phycobacter azelaicus]|uniref:helix-turn-helix domain-containing protein n=1 Tax=Phycobacter azelaicus TaxID=2668075 RepID=UPI0018675040|nr:helix-turn-helix domain-containing protein [Paracoccaceae bacterium]
MISDQKPQIIARQIRSPLAETAYNLPHAQSILLLLEAGQGQVGGASEELHFDAPRAVWLSTPRQGKLRLASGSRGEILQLSDNAIARALPATSLGDELARILRRDLSEPLSRQSERMTGWMQDLREELSGAEPASELAAEHLLSLLLIQIWRLAREQRPRSAAATGGLVQNFVQLVGLHLRDHWKVTDYANALGVSRDRLGSAVRRATGRSPQSYLHEALIREASELLANSGLSVAQVSFRLGFSDPAYFNRFFTRAQGLSPGRFRRKMATRGRQPTSFSAWP